MRLSRSNLLAITVAAWALLGVTVAVLVWQLLASPTHRIPSKFLVPSGVVGIVLAITGLFLATPKLALAGMYGVKNAKDRFDIENETRKTLAIILGGASFLIGSYISWQTYQETQSKDVKELLSKSVEQLANAKASIRMGGLQGLMSVMKATSNQKDRQDYLSVVTLLTTYLHDHSPRQSADKSAAGYEVCEGDSDLAKGKLPSGAWIDEGLIMRPDIFRALNILGNRPQLSSSYSDAMDLSFLNLCGVFVQAGHFEWAYMADSNLRRSNFQYDHLQHAQLDDVLADDLLYKGVARPTTFNCSHMEDAILSNARLRGAIFSHANLERASLNGVRAPGAQFLGANLAHANLRDANLHRALFNGANLQAVQLDSKTDLTGADLSDVFGLTNDDLDRSGAKMDQDTRKPTKYRDPKEWTGDAVCRSDTK